MVAVHARIQPTLTHISHTHACMPAPRAYVGHASHVMNIRFAPHNRWVVSVGGDDRGAFQWRVLAVAADDVIVDKPDFLDNQVYKVGVRLVPCGPRVGMRAYTGILLCGLLRHACVMCAAHLQPCGRPPLGRRLQCTPWMWCLSSKPLLLSPPPVRAYVRL